MAPHRRTWRERIPKAFAEARSLKGDDLRPKDVVDVLARELPSVERRHITDNVAKYLRKGPDGIYGIARSKVGAVGPSSPSVSSPSNETTSSLMAKTLPPADGQSCASGPTLVQEEILREVQHVRRTPFWKKLVEEADFIRDLEGE
jgi:hypothetical protein